MFQKNNKIGSVHQYRAQNNDVTCPHTSITKSHLEYQELEDYSSTGKKRPWIEKKSKSKLVSEAYYRLSEIYPCESEYFYKKADRIDHCGDYLRFKRFSDNSLKLHQAFSVNKGSAQTACGEEVLRFIVKYLKL